MIKYWITSILSFSCIYIYFFHSSVTTNYQCMGAYRSLYETDDSKKTKRGALLEVAKYRPWIVYLKDSEGYVALDIRDHSFQTVFDLVFEDNSVYSRVNENNKFLINFNIESGKLIFENSDNNTKYIAKCKNTNK